MIRFDHQREERIRLPESVFCQNKSVAMLNEIIAELVKGAAARVLFTRLDREKFGALDPDLATHLDYHELSGTALLGGTREERVPGKVAIITAGTSDLPVSWSTPVAAAPAAFKAGSEGPPTSATLQSALRISTSST